MDYTGNLNNEPKVLENKKILFMMNNLSHPSYVNAIDRIIGSIRVNNFYNLDAHENVVNISCRDDFESFMNNLERFKKNNIEGFERLKILIQTTDISSMSFSLTERFGFKIFVGRWFKDQNNNLRLNVLEIKPHMSEIDKDLEFQHNISKLCIGHKFDNALSKLKPSENRLNELILFKLNLDNPHQCIMNKLRKRNYIRLGE